jgi:hypothetical protein
MVHNKMRISLMSLNEPQIWDKPVHNNSQADKRSPRVRLLAGSFWDKYVKLRSTLASSPQSSY